MPSQKTKKTKIDHADIVHRFAERLKERRSALGLTQAEVAKRAEVNHALVRLAVLHPDLAGAE